MLRLVVQFSFLLSLGSQLLGTNLSEMNGSTRRAQLEQGQLINIVLDYTLNSSYIVSMYTVRTYLVLGELPCNSNLCTEPQTRWKG